MEHNRSEKKINALMDDLSGRCTPSGLNRVRKAMLMRLELTLARALAEVRYRISVRDYEQLGAIRKVSGMEKRNEW